MSISVIGVTAYGGPEVLHSIERPEPHAGPGEVRVQVRSAGVNPVDPMMRTGSPDNDHPGRAATTVRLTASAATATHTSN